MHALFAVRLADAVEVGDVVARARRLLEIEAQLLPALRRLEALDLFELLHARLHLRGVARPRLEARDERLLFGEHGLLPLDRALGLRVEERALPDVKFVISRENRQLAAVDLDDLVDDAVHELAIVGRHDERAVVRFQETRCRGGWSARRAASRRAS